MTYKCPSCGAPYNGKRCRKCLYENFAEEIAHGNHTHRGEPLVVDAPVRRPIPQQDPFACPPEAPKKAAASGRKSVKKFQKAILFFVILSLAPTIISCIISLVGGILTLVSEDSWADTESSSQMEAQPLAEITDGTVLYSDDDFSVVTDLKDGQPLDPEDTILIQVKNNTREDVMAYAGNIIVNGWLLNEAFFYCEPSAGGSDVDELTFDLEELAMCGIDSVESLSLQLQIYSEETYETLVTTDPIVLLAQQSTASLSGSQAAVGTPLYEGDLASIRLVGYQAASYSPDIVSEGTLLFYVENYSDSDISVYPEECTVNGKSCSLSLYAYLPAQTRTIAQMYLFDLEEDEIGVESLEDITSFQISFTILDYATGDGVSTDMLNIGTIGAIQ